MEVLFRWGLPQAAQQAHLHKLRSSKDFLDGQLPCRSFRRAPGLDRGARIVAVRNSAEEELDIAHLAWTNGSGDRAACPAEHAPVVALEPGFNFFRKLLRQVPQGIG